MSKNGNTNNNSSKLKQIINTFVNHENGYFICLSDDLSFVKLLTGTLYSDLGITKDCHIHHNEITNAVSTIKGMEKAKRKVILFVERFMKGRPTREIIENAKALHSNMLVIVLSAEVDRNALNYLFEVGMNNFIIKPLSPEILIEKISSTIKPQTKIGDLVEKGKMFLEQKKYTEAVEICDQILDIKPNSAAALMIKGDAYYRQGLKQQALNAYIMAHTSAKTFLEPLKRLITYYEKERIPNEHLDYLQKLDSLSPMNVSRKLEIGQLFLKQKNRIKAEEYFELAIETSKQEALNAISDVASSVVEVCMDTEGDEMAEQFCRKALDTKHELFFAADRELTLKLSAVLRAQGRWQEAASECERLLQQKDDALLRYHLSVCYLDGHKADEALQHMEKALQVNGRFYEGNSRYTYEIGRVFIEANQEERGREFIEKSLRYDPEHQAALNTLDNLKKTAH